MQAGPGTTSLRLRDATCLRWFLTTYPGKRRVMSLYVCDSGMGDYELDPSKVARRTMVRILLVELNPKA
jgi:hypothetical protein